MSDSYSYPSGDGIVAKQSDGTTPYWAPQGATHLWQCVDQASPPGGVHMACSSDGTDNGEYAMFTIPSPAIPAGAVINYVTVYFQSWGTCSVAVAQSAAGLLINSVGYWQTLFNVTPSPVAYSHQWTTNPATGAAWLVADVNGSGAHPIAQIGVRTVVATFWDGKSYISDQGFCNQIILIVDYTVSGNTYSVSVTINAHPTVSDASKGAPFKNSTPAFNTASALTGSAKGTFPKTVGLSSTSALSSSAKGAPFIKTVGLSAYPSVFCSAKGTFLSSVGLHCSPACADIPANKCKNSLLLPVSTELSTTASLIIKKALSIAANTVLGDVPAGDFNVGISLDATTGLYILNADSPLYKLLAEIAASPHLTPSAAVIFGSGLVSSVNLNAHPDIAVSGAGGAPSYAVVGGAGRLPARSSWTG